MWQKRSTEKAREILKRNTDLNTVLWKYATTKFSTFSTKKFRFKKNISKLWQDRSMMLKLSMAYRLSKTVLSLIVRAVTENLLQNRFLQKCRIVFRSEISQRRDSALFTWRGSYMISLESHFENQLSLSYVPETIFKRQTHLHGSRCFRKCHSASTNGPCRKSMIKVRDLYFIKRFVVEHLGEGLSL